MGEKLFPGAKTFEGAELDPFEIVIVGIDTKHDSKFGPNGHWLYDSRILLPLDPNKVANVRKHGVIKPIIVRKIDGRAYCLDGRQRVRWAREAQSLNLAEGGHKIMIRVIQRKGTEAQLHAASRSANAVVEAPDPITLAEEIAELLNQGVDPAEVAVDYGITEAEVKESQKLLELLSPKIRGYVASKQIGPTHAKQFYGKSFEEQDAMLEELEAGGGKITVERVRAARNSPRKKNGNGEALVGLTLKQIHKLYAAAEEHLEARDRKLLGALCGKIDLGQVKGLKAAYRELGFSIDGE